MLNIGDSPYKTQHRRFPHINTYNLPTQGIPHIKPYTGYYPYKTLHRRFIYKKPIITLM